MNKSLILKFPNNKQVPEHLLKHFIRGSVDGDGHIRRAGKNENSIAYNFQLLGTYEFLDSVLDFFIKNKIITNKKNIIKKDKRREKVNNFYITFHGNNARSIICYLYKDSKIYLNRKYEVAKNVIKILEL